MDTSQIIENLLDAAVRTSIDFFVVELTPALAEQLLLLNQNNRPLNDRHVRKLAREIERDHWRLTGQTIIISSTERLLNGQHTCEAVVRSGKTVLVAVAYGVDDDSFDAMDDTRKRTGGDVLACMGEKYASVTAAVLAQLQVYHERGPSALGQPMNRSNSDIRDMLELFPDAREFCRVKALGDVPSRDSVVGAFLYLIHKADRGKAREFLSLIRDGGARRGSPVFALTRRLNSDQRDGKRILDREYFALLIKAWNAFVSGRSMDTLIWRQGGDKPETFPHILGLRRGSSDDGELDRSRGEA